MAQAVLKATMFADNANGEKIQIGEQLDWRVSLVGPGGTGYRASRAAISLERGRGRRGAGWRLVLVSGAF